VVLDVSFDLLWVIIFSALFLIFYGFVQYHVQIRSKERKF
jgi:hypothetical protein